MSQGSAVLLAMSRRVDAYDGVRAVACLAVVGYHDGLPGLHGGLLGVDVFFVLSGFLITGLLIAQEARLSLRDFYARRLARLWPALVILVLLGLPFAAELGDARHGYGLTALLTLTFSTDLWLLTGDSGGHFLHTWSVGVEEQFYLVWPAVLVLVRSRRGIFRVAVAGATVSLLVAVGAATTRSSGTTWFLPQARAWELLAGCALGALPARLTRPLSQRAAAAAGWAGLLLLAAVLALADALGGLVTSPLMVMESMLSCAAALLMVHAASVHGTTWSSAMGWHPLTWVGRRSYGLYLYHVPIAGLIFGWGAFAGPVPQLVVLLLAGGLAAASFRWVEEPVRRAVARRTSHRREAISSSTRAGSSVPWALGEPAARSSSSPQRALHASRDVGADGPATRPASL